MPTRNGMNADGGPTAELGELRAARVQAGACEICYVIGFVCV